MLHNETRSQGLTLLEGSSYVVKWYDDEDGEFSMVDNEHPISFFDTGAGVTMPGEESVLSWSALVERTEDFRWPWRWQVGVLLEYGVPDKFHTVFRGTATSQKIAKVKVQNIFTKLATGIGPCG